ncbi:MAG: hypothetical protein IT423_24550 [Pirellulaceae bacterium]|nr:hypothetical protein [Pirellulaceae bacterium]
MQVNSNVDPAISNAVVQNQIDVAVVSKTRQVQKQQGEAAVALIQDAAQVTEQLANGRLDVKL